jgi:peptide/nickel transport system substrate-binding protein
MQRRDIIHGTAAAGLASMAGCAFITGDNDSGESENGGARVGPFTMTTLPRDFDAALVDSLNMAAQQWEELGITVDQERMDLAQWQEHALSHDYKLLQMGHGGRPSRLDPFGLLNKFWRSENAESGGQGYAEYQNSEFDEIVEQSNQTLDRQERKDLIYQAQEILCEDIPTVVLYYMTALCGVNTDGFSNWTNQVGNAPFTNVWNLGSVEPNGDDTDLIYATTQGPSTMNVMKYVTAAANNHIRLLYDQLMKIGPNGEPNPWAATEFEIVDDTTVDFTLREGMTFHDGEPVRPEDVKFSIEYYQDWEQPRLQEFYQVIDNVEIRENNVVRFNLASTFAPFVTVNVTQLHILPEHIWSGVADQEGLDHPSEWADPDLTTSGPVKVVQADPPDRMIYETNREHFAAKDWNIDQFIVQRFGGQAAAVGELEKGAADIVQNINPTQFGRLEEADGVEAVVNKDIGLWNIIMKVSEEPFDDHALRRAMAHATDQEQIVNVALQGYAEPGVAANYIAPANEFWNNPDVKTYNGGIERAREILEEAGYSWDDQGNLLRPAN